MTDPPVLVCKVAWMERYQGADGDKPIGGGGFVVDYGFGYEVYNFYPFNGRLYGYVRAPGNSGTFNIDRLSTRARFAQALGGVTVIWVATSPLDGTTYIVGWYNNATVYRKNRDPEGDLAQARHVLTGQGDEFKTCSYQIEADVRDGVCLALDERTFDIPVGRGKGGMGQARIWYPPDSKAGRLLERIQLQRR